MAVTDWEKKLKCRLKTECEKVIILSDEAIGFSDPDLGRITYL